MKTIRSSINRTMTRRLPGYNSARRGLRNWHPYNLYNGAAIREKRRATDGRLQPSMLVKIPDPSGREQQKPGEGGYLRTANPSNSRATAAEREVSRSMISGRRAQQRDVDQRAALRARFVRTAPQVVAADGAVSLWDAAAAYTTPQSAPDPARRQSTIDNSDVDFEIDTVPGRKGSRDASRWSSTR